MEFLKQFNDCIKKDELIGGLSEIQINNINVASDTTLQRGDLLAADNFQATFKLAAASDTSKAFAVAFKDFEASKDKTVTQAYVRGTFNREKLKVASSDTASVLATLEPALMRQEIFLTALRKWHEPEY